MSLVHPDKVSEVGTVIFSWQTPGLNMVKCFFSNRKWAVLHTKPEMNHISWEILTTQTHRNPKHF
jgi:hypothetical protein